MLENGLKGKQSEIVTNDKTAAFLVFKYLAFDGKLFCVGFVYPMKKPSSIRQIAPSLSVRPTESTISA